MKCVLSCALFFSFLTVAGEYHSGDDSALSFNSTKHESHNDYKAKKVKCRVPDKDLAMVYLPKDRSKLGFIHFGNNNGENYVCPIMGRGVTAYNYNRTSVTGVRPSTQSSGATPPGIYQVHPNAKSSPYVKGRWGSPVPFDLHIMATRDAASCKRSQFACHSKPYQTSNGKTYKNFCQIHTAGCLKPSQDCLQKLNEHFHKTKASRGNQNDLLVKAQKYFKIFNGKEASFKVSPSHSDHPSKVYKADDRKINHPENMLFVVNEFEDLSYEEMSVKVGHQTVKLCH